MLSLTWARTLSSVGDRWVQVDRGALHAQAVFLVGGERDAYMAGEPADDDRFVPVFAHSLEHGGWYAPEEARRVAGTLLPEILSYDPTRPASFPNNGRTLTDDTGDAFVAVFTNGKVTGDKVGAHAAACGVSLFGTAAQRVNAASGFGAGVESGTARDNREPHRSPHQHRGLRQSRRERLHRSGPSPLLVACSHERQGEPLWAPRGLTGRPYHELSHS
jgi:hypothetical protein